MAAPPATPAPTETPAPAIRSSDDPIIGIWMWTTFDRSKTIFYTFTYDHQYFSSDSRNEGAEKGTWTKASDNSYSVTVDGRKTRMIVYQPTTDSIAQADTPEIRFTPKPVSTPRPAPVKTQEPALEIGPIKIG